MKKIIFIILLLTFCITSNIFAEENKEENASDTQKITQNATNSDSAHNDLKEIKESREEFKKLVDAYHKNPTEENLVALRKQITTNYDKGIERKKAKIEELNNKIEKLKKKDKKDRKDRKNRKDRKDRKDKKDKNDKKEVKEKKQSLKNETKEISNEKEKDVLKKDK